MPTHPHRPLMAIALRLAAMLAFAVQLALVKLAGEAGTNLAEIVFWRQWVAIPLLLGWMALAGRLELVGSARYLVHGRRAALGLSSMTLTLGATLLLPLAEMTTLTFTGPLFAVILSALLLKEHVGPYRWFAVALGFVGVAIVAQPGGQALNPLGIELASAAALLNGLITIQVRDLNRTEHPMTIVLLFSCFSMLPMVPLQFVYATAHPAPAPPPAAASRAATHDAPAGPTAAAPPGRTRPPRSERATASPPPPPAAPCWHPCAPAECLRLHPDAGRGDAVWRNTAAGWMGSSGAGGQVGEIT